jgi:prepilin-type N-terminal cleavage/methylation domain-containing protein
MTRPAHRESGYTLIEVLVAIGLVLVGVMGLEGAIAYGVRRLTASQEQLVAGQRAAEAIESVFKARDNRILTWAQIRNVHGVTGGDGGVFLDGPQGVKDSGPDGLVNTADDGALEQIVTPGPDGLLGTADDIKTPLIGFSREIKITDISPNLRQLQVIVRYPTANGQATYVVTTYISSYA